MKSRLYHWNYLWLLLFTAGWGFFLIGMPLHTDDYRYLQYIKYWFDAQGITTPENGGNIFTHGLPFQGMADMMRISWQLDNIRLANFLATLLLCFPKWFNSGLMLLIFMLSVLTGFRLAGVDTRRSPLVPLTLVMLTFMLPWDDNFGSFDFQMNYIFPAWLGITLLWRLRPEAPSSPPDKILNVLIAIALGIAHEGFGVPFVCGLLALCLTKRRWRRPDIIAAAILTLVGSLVLLRAPGMHIRAAHAHSNLPQTLHFFLVLRLKDFLLFNIPAYTIFLTLSIICLLLRRTRRQLCSPLFIFTLISASAALGVKLISSAEPRMFFWPEFICIFGSLQLLLLLSHRKLNRYNTVTAPCSAILLVPLYLNLAFTGYYAIQCRRSMTHLIERMLDNPHDYHFGEPYRTEDTPAICGTLPGNSFCTNAMLNTDYYYGIHDPDNDRIWFIIPSVLEHVTSTSGTDISGGQGIRRVGNHFFMPFAPGFDANHKTGRNWEPVATIGNVDFGDGPERWVIRFYKFKSNGDGNYYYWLVIKRNWYTTHFKPIQSITLRDNPPQ